ncbi:AAA family ATPase [Paenarthrobacter nitroguajacolicus]|uniref:AAA family ATPase n=1 Tax=Paenarthrobacter nitroguajacolicus TaxID=211146 RepID=UPI00285ADDF1|nr:AAA family ATPase [Paenarthrobacter nitroguajacolicus]MDR6637079.1 5-methylcytosine-specific restriction protein B [Paenarthrobacter nitroguajacolicus]
MAVFSEQDRGPIDELCAQWRQRSLNGDASVLYPDDFPDSWSKARLDELNTRFWGNLLEGKEGGGTFESKWEQQLEGAPVEVRLLAAECLLVYYLITQSVGPARKLEMINKTIGPDNPELHVRSDSETYQALQQWIAHPGQYYNTRQDLHVGYLMDLVSRLKQKPPEDRAALLHENPWGFAQFAEEGDRQSDAMRHVVCHLLYPKYFERIASSQHKALVLKAFGELDTSDADASEDEKLYSIRQALKQRLSDWDEDRRDYYSSDLEPIWRPVTKSGDNEALDPAFALEFKKQIVFYGPPGSGKTYRAGKLAESLIRTAALQRWGVGDYFRSSDVVDQAVAEHVTRLQMHPSYGYAEFMVGLRLDADGGTTYQLGALPRLVERIRTEREHSGTRALPHVLILDEINRTDLSTMFGEAFSAMERDKRDIELELFAEGSKGEPILFSIPGDLYIIGTMNEIDQSVEALDFALRRRFFWFATPYDEEDLYAIWKAQWTEQLVAVDWEDGLPQLEKLAGCISELNARIGELPELGPEYELGAAVFGDLPYFIGREWLNKRHGRSSGKYLWDGNGKPLAPLRSLWALSIQPVLEQYLAGSDRRAEQLAGLEELLLIRPKS